MRISATKRNTQKILGTGYLSYGMYLLAAALFIAVTLSYDPDLTFDLHLTVTFAASALIFSPLERVQLLLQTKGVPSRVLDDRSKEIQRLSGIRQCVARVQQQFGLAAFWRGCSASVLHKSLTGLLSGGIIHIVTGGTRIVLLIPAMWRWPLIDQAINMSSHGTAALIWTVLFYPLDYAYTRLAYDLTEAQEFKGPIDVLRKVYSRNGYPGLFVGIHVALYELLVLHVYHMTMLGIVRHVLGSTKWLNWMSEMRNAAIMIPLAHLGANILCGLVTYPFQTVRRRLIVQGETEQKYKNNVKNCMDRIALNEGMGGFYKGVLVKAVLSGCTVMFNSFLIEWMMKKYADISSNDALKFPKW